MEMLRKIYFFKQIQMQQGENNSQLISNLALLRYPGCE